MCDRLPQQSDKCERCAQSLQQDKVWRVWCPRCGYRRTRRHRVATHGADNPFDEAERAERCFKCGEEASSELDAVLRCALCGISVKKPPERGGAPPPPSLTSASFRVAYAGLGKHRAEALRCTVAQQLYLVQIVRVVDSDQPIGLFLAESSEQVQAALAEDLAFLRKRLHFPYPASSGTARERLAWVRRALCAGDDRADRLRILPLAPTIL